MQDSGHYVPCSGRIVLECGCGEKLVLLGLEDDWYSERTAFECECGEELILADRADEEANSAEELLNSLEAPRRST